jgi:hypothetical protein
VSSHITLDSPRHCVAGMPSQHRLPTAHGVLAAHCRRLWADRRDVPHAHAPGCVARGGQFEEHFSHCSLLRQCRGPSRQKAFRVVERIPAVHDLRGGSQCIALMWVGAFPESIADSLRMHCSAAGIIGQVLRGTAERLPTCPVAGLQIRSFSARPGGRKCPSSFSSDLHEKGRSANGHVRPSGAAFLEGTCSNLISRSGMEGAICHCRDGTACRKLMRSTRARRKAD